MTVLIRVSSRPVGPFLQQIDPGSIVNRLLLGLFLLLGYILIPLLGYTFFKLMILDVVRGHK